MHEIRKRLFPPLVLLSAVLLAGCGGPRTERAVYAEHYCYRTLAKVDCHEAALAAEHGRRVGHFEAPVAIESAPGIP